MKTRTALLSAAVCGAIALAPVTAWAETPKRGGELKFAVSAEPPNYDCHANSSFAFIHPVRPHYNTLLRFVPDKYPEVEGDLAESWEVSADSLTYTFKLKSGVKFHDADLLGLPLRLTVGKRGIENGVAELKIRRTGETSEIPLDALVSGIKTALEQEHVWINAMLKDESMA